MLSKVLIKLTGNIFKSFSQLTSFTGLFGFYIGFLIQVFTQIIFKYQCGDSTAAAAAAAAVVVIVVIVLVVLLLFVVF